jgi:hypothetical protein
MKNFLRKLRTVLLVHCLTSTNLSAMLQSSYTTISSLYKVIGQYRLVPRSYRRLTCEPFLLVHCLTSTNLSAMLQSSYTTISSLYKVIGQYRLVPRSYKRLTMAAISTGPLPH